MDLMQDHELVQELLDFPISPGPDSDQQSTSSLRSYELIQQNPGETEWGAILRKLEESPAMSAAGMIDDHLGPSSSASAQNPADDAEQIQTPPHVGICSSLMSSFEYMDSERHTQFNASNGDDHLDFVLDELLFSYNGHQYLGTAQQSEENHRHIPAHSQTHEQCFNWLNQPERSNSGHCYSYNMNHVDSGSCTPATSASSDDPVDYMEEQNLDQPELNTINSTDQSSSLTTVAEDHSQQHAPPGDKSHKKRDSKGNCLRVKKPKKQRSPRLEIWMQSDIDIVDDGFKWRKYGQKAVKDSPYPRSYYKCTDKRCNVKKHVERQRNEPDVVVTTYEGVHTHATPSSNHTNKESDSNAPNYDNHPHLHPASRPDPISHYSTAYLASLNIIAHYIASCTYNNTCNHNQLPPHLSSCPPSLIPSINHPTSTTPPHDSTLLDHQLRHRLLQVLMHHQDIMARSSHSA